MACRFLKLVLSQTSVPLATLLIKLSLSNSSTDVRSYFPPPSTAPTQRRARTVTAINNNNIIDTAVQLCLASREVQQDHYYYT